MELEDPPRVEVPEDYSLYQWMPGHRLEHMVPQRVPPSIPLTTFSVVVISFDEHDFVKRTLDSIFEFTNSDVLVELILVDDHSSPPLTNDFNMADYPAGKLKYILNTERIGLIQSRARGANVAQGDVIVFLDCHVKPKPNWETSILQRINENYRHIVVPAIPVLDGDTWDQKGDAVGYKMMMEWDLNFHWFEDGTDDVPIMSGGLLAISKDWWHESGEYDPDMLQWGGENIEQSLRGWLCGGEISVARDSQVMHMFRKKFPYKLDGGKVALNKERTVLLWFDQFLPLYLKDKAGKDEATLRKTHDLTAREQLKIDLGCKKIDWWVERFREVLTSRGMIPARTFQLRWNGPNTTRPSMDTVPTFPVPPDLGPSEPGVIEEDGLCLIPVGSLERYFELALENVNSNKSKSEGMYKRFTKALDEDRSIIASLLAHQTSKNITMGLTLVPCSPENHALRWRQGGDEMDNFIYVGQSTRAGFGQCMTLSETYKKSNALLTNCKFNVWKQNQSDRLDTNQRFKVITGDMEGLRSSNVSSPEDLASIALMMHVGEDYDDEITPSCLGITQPWREDMLLTELPTLVNTDCLDGAPNNQLNRWAEVNHIWALHATFEKYQEERRNEAPNGGNKLRGNK